MTVDVKRWKEVDAASYEQVAEAFDIYSRRLSSEAATRLLALAAIQSEDRLLDVGTGTGLLPFELLRSASPFTGILGVDISSGMIATARSRLRDRWNGDSRVQFARMDAEKLHVEPATFDVVVSAFALTHIPQPARAMGEMFRVLRPGGRLAIAVGSQPPRYSFARVRHAVKSLGRKFAELRGHRLTGELLDEIVLRRLGHSTELPVGTRLATELNRVAELTRLVRDAGFVGTEVSWCNYEHRVDSAEEFWDIHRTIRSNARKQLLVAPQQVAAEIRDEFLRRSKDVLARGGVLSFPTSVVFLTASRPGREGGPAQ